MTTFQYFTISEIRGHWCFQRHDSSLRSIFISSITPERLSVMEQKAEVKKLHDIIGGVIYEDYFIKIPDEATYALLELMMSPIDLE